MPFPAARLRGDAKIVKVLTVSNEKYEAFVRNSLGNDGDFEFAVEPGSDTTIGGSESNDPRLEALVPHSDEYMKIYRESMVQLVHAVVSPNRRTIYINSHGYNYARYIGIDSNTVL